MPAQQSLDALSTEHLRSDLRGRSVRGGLTSLISQGAQFLIQTVATVVLARLLTPVDFGLVAMVTAVTALAAGFADLGLSEATIQRDEINHNQVSTLFWINLAVGIGLTLLTISVAPVLVWVYREQRLKYITYVLASLFLINCLRVQPEALLKRQMRFSALAVRDVVSLGIAVPFAIAMARHGYGYWALVALPVVGSFLQMALSWFMVPWRPSLPRRDAKVGSMIAFGSHVAASYFIVNVNRSADNALIGWYWRAGPLGLYSKAYNLLMLPVRQLCSPASNVAIPAFSRTQNDPERFARYYLRAVNLLMWIGALVFGFLFVAAQPVIVLMLGNQWKAAAPVFQILAVGALGQLLLESTIWLFVSRGQSRQLFRLLLVISPIIIASYAIGLPFGIKGVALSGSLVLLAILPWMLKVTFRGTELTLARLARALLYPVALSLAGVLLAELALHLFAPQHIFSQLLVAAMSFATAYLLSALILPVREEIMSLTKLSKELRPSSQTA